MQDILEQNERIRRNGKPWQVEAAGRITQAYINNISARPSMRGVNIWTSPRRYEKFGRNARQGKTGLVSSRGLSNG